MIYYKQLVLFKDALSKTPNLSNKELAQLLNISPRQVTRKLKKLEEAGVIGYKIGKGRSHTKDIILVFTISILIMMNWMSLIMKILRKLVS